MAIVTTEVPRVAGVRITRAHSAFATFAILSAIVFWKVFRALIVFSLSHESSSHVMLIPLVSIYFLYTERSRIFLDTHTSLIPGGAVILAAISLYLFVGNHFSVQDPEQFLPGATLSIVMLWLGGFLLCYGGEAWRRASFSLLFLLLMIPLPPTFLERTIYLLQQGSTQVTYLLLRAIGVPVLRQGFVLAVPSVTIEVAQECSGIRSSVALLITCLLASHLFLRTKWKMLVFVLLAFPLAILKNGIRITTLTLLSIYVDPAFLRGDLHRDGGFVFFVLALLILFPVFLLLEKSDKPQRAASATS
jgi:exosortase